VSEPHDSLVTYLNHSITQRVIPVEEEDTSKEDTSETSSPAATVGGPMIAAKPTNNVTSRTPSRTPSNTRKNPAQNLNLFFMLEDLNTSSWAERARKQQLQLPTPLQKLRQDSPNAVSELGIYYRFKDSFSFG
jgi:hypothetical protein